LETIISKTSSLSTPCLTKKQNNCQQIEPITLGKLLFRPSKLLSGTFKIIHLSPRTVNRHWLAVKIVQHLSVVHTLNKNWAIINRQIIGFITNQTKGFITNQTKINSSITIENWWQNSQTTWWLWGSFLWVGIIPGTKQYWVIKRIKIVKEWL
jgi:hypothetical protein